jgi:DNA helicase-2/ATP-dependent DNA helicase PcrA
MFYDAEVGHSLYMCPIGVIEGNMLLKRQYRIENGKMVFMFDSSVKIDDEVLQEILGKSADDRMKTIVTSIQKEQNKVIRDDKHRHLMVLGPAGSGKTSIALHRAAYLLYRHKDTLNAKSIVIFSPNQVFNDYISSVLPKLGEENINQTTFMEYAARILEEDLNLEDFNDQMEYLVAEDRGREYDTRLKGINFKASLDFLALIRNYESLFEKECIIFEDIFFNDKTVISKEELQSLFQKEYTYLPVVKRLMKIRQRVLFLMEPLEKERLKEIEEELANGDGQTARNEIKARSRLNVFEEFRPAREKLKAMTSLDIYDAYCRLYSDDTLFDNASQGIQLPCGIDEIRSWTFDRLQTRSIAYEDVAPLLYLNGEWGSIPDMSYIKHVIIDEAQDYTPIQYEIIKRLFPESSMTALGDLSQAVNPAGDLFHYETVKEILGTKSTAFIELGRSYRSTAEITLFARKILRYEIESGYVQREGEKPDVVQVNGKTELARTAAGDIKALKCQGCNSIALICKTSRQSRECFRQIKDMLLLSGINPRLVTKDDTEFSSGVVVIPSYLSKGLEFDAVLVWDAGEGNYRNEEERKLLYTICTRALHKLVVYYTGKLSPLLSHIDPDLYSLRS